MRRERRGSARRRRSPPSRPTPAFRRPIPASPPRRAVWRRRRSGTSPRSAAISPSVRAAGTIAIPHIACLKKGGSECPAREGNHLYGVAFDLGPCVAPHPSTMATALLAYDAKVATNQRQGLSIEQLLGDGSNGAADHALNAGEMIEAIELAPPARRRTRGLQARDQPRLRRMAAGRSRRARRRRAGRVSVRASCRRRGCARSCAARRG